MSSQFLGIRDAVIAALQAPTALAGGHILPGLDVPLPPEKSQGIRVGLLRTRGEAIALAGEVRRWQTPVVVKLLARASAGVDGITAIDPLFISAYARLAAMAPPSGVVSVTLDLDFRWDTDEADQSVIAMPLVLIVTHTTTTANLE